MDFIKGLWIPRVLLDLNNTKNKRNLFSVFKR